VARSPAIVAWTSIGVPLVGRWTMAASDATGGDSHRRSRITEVAALGGLARTDVDVTGLLPRDRTRGHVALSGCAPCRLGAVARDEVAGARGCWPTVKWLRAVVRGRAGAIGNR